MSPASYLEQLEGRKAENEALCVVYREKIQQLWERLQIPPEERENMAVHMSLSKKRNMDAVSLIFVEQSIYETGLS